MDEELIRRAREAREHAYAPYSGYRVGAAIRSADGRVWTGSNVENVSFGATLCAERIAIGAMISGGERVVKELALATQDGGTPCGICLQVLSEFAEEDTEIVLDGGAGGPVAVSLAGLFPQAFRSAQVRRTETGS